MICAHLDSLQDMTMKLSQVEGLEALARGKQQRTVLGTSIATTSVVAQDSHIANTWQLHVLVCW
jgi:hypothetical protein